MGLRHHASLTQLRVHTTHNSKFYILVSSRAIIEDCSQAQFAPYNWAYPDIEKHFEVSPPPLPFKFENYCNRPCLQHCITSNIAAKTYCCSYCKFHSQSTFITVNHLLLAPLSGQDAGLDGKRNNWSQVDDFNWLASRDPSPNWSVLPEAERAAAWD